MKELEKASREFQEKEFSFFNGKGLARDLHRTFIEGAEWQAKQSPWISVEDRLPDFKDGLVNVRCKNKNKEDGIWLYDICYIDEDTNTWGKRHHTWETITHWMPIPE